MHISGADPLKKTNCLHSGNNAGQNLKGLKSRENLN